MNKLRERLAELEHEQWSHWETYRKKRMRELDPDNDLNCDKMVEQIENWNRLRKTKYQDLTEKEKESDRKWADKVLDILMESKGRLK